MPTYAISNVPRRVVYAASGTGPYNFTFEILAATDLAVYKDDVLLTLTTNYTVTINANGTGYITLTAAPTGATQIAIVGARAIQRTSDFVTGGDFFANVVNDELDSLTIFSQQNAEVAERALKAPQTDPTSINMVLPRASVRANKTLAFDSNGNPVTGEVIGNNRGNWAAGVAYNKRDIVKDTSNGNVYYANTAHTSSGSRPISTNADSAKWDLLVDNASAASSAAAAASSASAASTSASNASTSASNAASSASAASTSASNASTSASNASTSATNAANSATTAAGHASTASTQATNAAGSASAASTSASNASSSASAASTSASNASTSATAAAGSASAASTSASNAASSASTATTQASNASTSATNAANSATAAQAAQTAAESAYDSFDDRYLGAKSSNPSVDNDGNALITGAIYFNTVANEMRVWTGSAWQQQAASPDTLSERTFAATAGQTSYTFTGGYRVNYTYVWVNGVLLDAADIVATNGTTITFNSALQLNDEVRILSFKAAGSIAVSDITGLQTALDAKASLTGAETLTNKTIAYANNTLTGVPGLSANNTFTGTQTFNGTSSVISHVMANAAETTTISATAATGTINYDVTTQSVLYYTSNASANWTVNFRGSSGTSLNTLMSTGQSITVAFLVTQGGTAYYNNAVQVDGSSVTPKYQGGTAWSAGNASSIDGYTYTIVKTGNAAFTIFAAQTKFA